MLKFDLGSLSLDLGEEAAPEPSSEPVKADDPLATKLALSEEFVAIGDVEGARALIEEVIAEATGDIQLKAKIALNNLQSL
jgi:pilus assembly protein FimV